MRPEISFFTPGIPAPQGSKRAFVVGGRARMVEDNAKTKPWRATVTAYARDAIGTEWDATGPMKVHAVFYFPRPASHYGTGRNAQQRKPSAPRLFKATKPDLDKLTRALLDALTDAGVWRDDAQVAYLEVLKRWSDDTTVGVHVLIGSDDEGVA